VTQVNALLEQVSVRITKGDSSDIHVFTADQVQRVNPPQPRQESKAQAKPAAEAEPLTESDEEFMGTPYTILEDENMPDD